MGNVLCCDGAQLANRGHYSPTTENRRNTKGRPSSVINKETPAPNLVREKTIEGEEDYENDAYFT